MIAIVKLRNVAAAAAAVVWLCCAAPARAAAAADERQWTVDGIQRTGLVVTPAADVRRPAAGWPVVFVFHGHGGTARGARRQFQVDTLWPEAVVVYLQGLPTVGPLTDPAGVRAGWDMAHPAEANRDVRLYDVVRRDLIGHDHADPRRVFVAGHSNGGGFAFVLWADRGDMLAAVAVSSSVAPAKDRPRLQPKPALMSSGRADPLVKFEWQAKMVDRLKVVNGVDATGRPWGENGTWYPSGGGTPLATIVTDGGHAPPPHFGERVVEFFKAVQVGTATTRPTTGVAALGGR